MIVLRAKNVDFEVTYINLREKPDWFLEISPHGKVPVLKVDDDVLFESNAIAEYLDEIVEPRLHPEDPIKRARNRAWNDYVPDFSRGINFYYTKTEEEMQEKIDGAAKPLSRLEEAIKHGRGNDGPYFNGDKMSLVDASYAPFFQRFLFVEGVVQTGLLNDYPLVKAWAEALMKNEAVTGSVVENFTDLLVENFKRREFLVASRFESPAAAAE